MSNLIVYIFIAVIVIFVVHTLFNSIYNKEEYDDIESIPIELSNNDYNMIDYEEPIKTHKIDKNNECPLIINNDETDAYLTTQLAGDMEQCDRPVKSRKQFNKDFFNFRDLTQNNSNWGPDPVDNIQQLYLSGNTDEARSHPGMKIKDIFDEATKGHSLYDRHCVRLPKFDNINFDGYYMSYGQHPMHQTRDNWTYPKEKIINGGEINNGLYGDDPSFSNNMPYDIIKNA